MPSPRSDGSKSSSEWGEGDNNEEKGVPIKANPDDASDSWGEHEGGPVHKHADEADSWDDDGDSWGAVSDEEADNSRQVKKSKGKVSWDVEFAGESDDWSEAPSEKEAGKPDAQDGAGTGSARGGESARSASEGSHGFDSAATDEEGLRAAGSTSGEAAVIGAASDSLTIHAASAESDEEAKDDEEEDEEKNSYIGFSSDIFKEDSVRESRLKRCLSALRAAGHRCKLRIMRCYRHWRRILFPLMILVAIVLFPLTCLWCCCCSRRSAGNADDEDLDLESSPSGSSAAHEYSARSGSSSVRDDENRVHRSSLKKMSQHGVVGGVQAEQGEAIKKIHQRARRTTAREVMDTLGGNMSPKGLASPVSSRSPRGSVSPRGIGSPGRGDVTPGGGRKTFARDQGAVSPGRRAHGSVSPGRVRPAGSGGSPTVTPRAGARTPRDGSPRVGSPVSGGRSPAASSRERRKQRLQDKQMNAGTKRKPKREARDKSRKTKRRCSYATIVAYYNSFQLWREEREINIRDTWILVCDIVEEDEWDYENLDEFGNPKKVVHWIPSPIRARWNFFLIIYWDPFVDSLDKLPSCKWIFLIMLRATPSLSFSASIVWLSISIYGNMQYKQGDCVVEKLPESFENDGNVVAHVEGVYVVERSFPPTPLRPEGVVLQECVAKVLCDRIDFGESSSKDDDRCASFESWSWGDKIACYYHKDDLYGTAGEQLYCLGPPYPLFTKIFTVVVAGTILVLALVIYALLSWRERDLKRQEKLATAEAAKEMEEKEAAKRAIEVREAEEAERQRKRLRGEEDGYEEDLSVDEEGLDFGVDPEGAGDDGEGV